MKFQIKIFDDNKEYGDVVMDLNTGLTMKIEKKRIHIDIKEEYGDTSISGKHSTNS